MYTSQLSCYTAKVAGSSQTQTIEAIQRTLSAQSGLLNGSLANLGPSAPLNELQILLSIWNEEVSDLNSLDMSIVAETSKVNASISSANRIIASASEAIHHIFVDWNSCDRLRILSNATDTDKLEIPITIEQETRRSVGGITLVSHQTLTTTLSGNKNDLCEVVTILEEKGSNPEQFGIADIQCFLTYVNPQEIKLNLQYAYLLINDTEIDFSKAKEQFFLLRAMFGRRGKNRPKIEFEDFYNFWSEQEHIPLDWDAFGEVDDGKKRAEFIHKIRNTVTNINNKIRKTLGGTEDFLKAKDNTCYINPKLLNLRKS